MGSTAGANKARKKELAHSKAIHCGFCPYHRGENRKRHVKHGAQKAKRHR